MFLRRAVQSALYLGINQSHLIDTLETLQVRGKSVCGDLFSGDMRCKIDSTGKFTAFFDAVQPVFARQPRALKIP